MNILFGYVTLGLIGICSSQFLIRGVRLQQPRVRISRQFPTASASASASASAAASSASASGVAGIDLGSILGSSGGLLSSLIGGQQAISIPIRKARTVVRPRTIEIRRPAFPISTIGGTPIAVPATGLHTPVIFSPIDTPDPNTPDTPDLVYAPRSLMGDFRQVEAIRNNAEADGVVFV